MLKSMETDAGTVIVDIDSVIALHASFSYNRIAARDWARKNWNAAPEYSSSEVPETDCANFVSKALNAGGIPEDKSGNWYRRASTWVAGQDFAGLELVIMVIQESLFI